MRSSAIQHVGEEQQSDCPLCGTEDAYVLYEDEKMCATCGHAPAGDEHGRDVETPWQDWWEHRNEEYDGLYGEERVRVPGGFVSAYDFENDF